MSKTTITVRQSLNNAMSRSMSRDENVILLGEEVGEYQGAYKVSQGLLQKFGSKRVIDTPITEHGFTGMAIGMAFNGLKPIVEFMTFNFAMQAIDQIINSAAKTSYMSGGEIKCPIVFRGPNGSASGVAAQHSQCYASWYAHCPGLKVVAPFEADHAEQLLMQSIESNCPVVFLEHELAYGIKFPIKTPDSEIQIGKAFLGKEGTDVTIVGFSWIMSKIYEATKILEQEGISVEVIDLLTIRPLDIKTIIKSVKKTNRIVIVEEGWGFAGIGAEISAQVSELAFDFLDHNPERVFAADVPLPYAKNLEQAAIPSTEQIINAAKKTLYKNR